MSVTKRWIEDEIERIAGISGYDYCFLMEKFNEAFSNGLETTEALEDVEKAAVSNSYPR